MKPTPVIQGNLPNIGVRPQKGILYTPVVPTPGQLILSNGPAEPLPCKYINNAIYADQPQLQKGHNSYLGKSTDQVIGIAVTPPFKFQTFLIHSEFESI